MEDIAAASFAVVVFDAVEVWEVRSLQQQASSSCFQILLVGV
jgi:hypothetical protein